MIHIYIYIIYLYIYTHTYMCEDMICIIAKIVLYKL